MLSPFLADSHRKTETFLTFSGDTRIEYLLEIGQWWIMANYQLIQFRECTLSMLKWGSGGFFRFLKKYSAQGTIDGLVNFYREKN